MKKPRSPATWALLGISADGAGVTPVEVHGHGAGGEGRSDVTGIKVEGARRRVLDALDVVLKALQPAGIVDLRVHGFGIEEHRARMVGMVRISSRVTKEKPELLAAAHEGFCRAVEIVVRAREELGNVVILIPGLGRGQIVAIFLLERRLFCLILEEIAAIGAGVHVAVDGDGDLFTVPHHQTITIGRVDVLPVGTFGELRGDFRKKRREVAMPGGGVQDDVEGSLAGGHRGHEFGVELTKGKVDDVDCTARLCFPGLTVIDGGPADEGWVHRTDGDLDARAFGCDRGASRQRERHAAHTGTKK